jgi:hypothetical protein
MRYLALACDYDGTVASGGCTPPPVEEALDRLAASGRRVLLVTGRQLNDLLTLLPRPERFDWIVAENGAVLYHPASRQTTDAAERVPAAVVEALPAGITKATGLTLVLRHLKLSPHNVVGIGDAENDHAFLSVCECSVAVANAVPMLKARADVVMDQPAGQGVIALAEQLLADDLAAYEPRLTRHAIVLGTDEREQPVTLPPYGRAVLIAGASGSGKSTLATAYLERLVEHGYQCCLIDPEGDYETFPNALVLGDPSRAPTADQTLQALDRVEGPIVVNLLGLPLGERPGTFAKLLPLLQHHRIQTGRPHWLAVDEAHHLLPRAWANASQTLPRDLANTLFLTVHPDELSPAVLALVEIVIAVGDQAPRVLHLFAAARGLPAPDIGPDPVPPGHALIWEPASGQPPRRFRTAANRTARQRHRRKYATGDVGPERCFVFRGPRDRLHLRARNLMSFIDIAEGLDDSTWLHHLRRGDYSQWFRETIKDDALAQEAADVEGRLRDSAKASRARIRAAIERRYTLPELMPPEAAPTSLAAAGADAHQPHDPGGRP